jgi:hypothetical protein
MAEAIYSKDKPIHRAIELPLHQVLLEKKEGKDALQCAWTQFVKNEALNPRLDAKDFYKEVKKIWKNRYDEGLVRQRPPI